MSYAALFPSNFPANDKPDCCVTPAPAPDTSLPDGTMNPSEGLIDTTCPPPLDDDDDVAAAATATTGPGPFCPKK